MDQQLIAILSSPIAFGGLLSWTCEQTKYFNDEDNSPLIKLAIVFVICLVYAIIYTVLGATGLPTTVLGWRGVLMFAISVAVGSQIFHWLANTILPGLDDKLNALLGSLTPAPAPAMPGFGGSFDIKQTIKGGDSQTPGKTSGQPVGEVTFEMSSRTPPKPTPPPQIPATTPPPAPPAAPVSEVIIDAPEEAPLTSSEVVITPIAPAPVPEPAPQPPAPPTRTQDGSMTLSTANAGKPPFKTVWLDGNQYALLNG